MACRDCALNMVEFGAGGQITQPSDDSGATGTTGGESAVPSASGSGGTGAMNMSRRRRKAKGWYCPVCRQRECFFVISYAILTSLKNSLYFLVEDYRPSALSGRNN